MFPSKSTQSFIVQQTEIHVTSSARITSKSLPERMEVDKNYSENAPTQINFYSPTTILMRQREEQSNTVQGNEEIPPPEANFNLAGLSRKEEKYLDLIHIATAREQICRL
ncbi:hypothetical protein AVEN_248672-1 [Araneus ventricosus]|uniref:Uncharacterized protein n=1 Tax=Araneus ventricosus TaxID=182803 RepID=A0A4Y2BZS0_ARAVE|nr:hypothetical protein AVEN_248672-1 [Araneus ventricosus]